MTLASGLGSQFGLIREVTYGTQLAPTKFFEIDSAALALDQSYQDGAGLRANRSLMNREGGYWVLSTDPAAADHVWQTRIPLRAGQRFAIASDGFLRLVELFGTATPADLLAISGAEDAARRIERLRDLERQPDSLRRFTRVKPHDDASLVVCIWKDT